MKTNLIGISGDLGDTVGKMLQYLDYCNRYPNNMRTFDNWLNNGGTSGNHQIKRFDNKRTDIVCLLLGCTRKQLEKDLDKELGEEWWVYKFPSGGIDYYRKDVPDFWDKYLIKLTPRKLLQLLGTEAGREILHPNIWVNALFADYKTFNEPSRYPNGGGGKAPNWIITDVRFPNEAQAIKDRGGIVIRVNRDWRLAALSDLENGGKAKDFFENDSLNKIKEHSSETALDDYDFDEVIDNNGSIEELVEKVKQLNLV